MSPRSPREISVLVPPGLAPLYPDDPSRIGPYLVLGRLGQGGTGTVYAAVDVSSPNVGERLVAVKTLVSPELEDPSTYPALTRRLRSLAGIESDRVVTPLVHDTDANPPWLAMPYTAGERLSHYVTKRGGLGSGKLIALAVGLAEGLSVLHARSVSHGAVRPSEIMLGPDGPHIMDCAVAPSASRMRGHGATWLSPERYRGGAPSPAADVFAWGAVVAFAGTGRLPFGTGEADEIAERAADGAFDLGDLEPGLRPVVGRALDPDPDRRPSLREVVGAVIAVWQAEHNADSSQPGRDEISRILEREWHAIEPPARVPEVVRLEGHMAGKRPTRFVFAAGTAVLALALIGTGVWGVGRLLPSPGDDEPSAEAAADAAEEAEAEEEETTVVVRLDPSDQEDPEEGPYVYTPVDRDDTPIRDQGAPTHEYWASEWDEVGEPDEAEIDPDAEVLCAKFCTAPDDVHIDDDFRGTLEIPTEEFLDYLSWGPVMILEVTFDEESMEDDGPREIVQVTELFTD
ncbi:serine/threonine-protein kinase [Nocardiopsis salina]|uniref:serine/threonine-protein kinase n=1 Tax=Nocardiopsis salina TaxID=245836 RepID=UPI0003491604|nr:serine/threonine-protein kinase [Nocardiopsis salina]